LAANHVSKARVRIFEFFVHFESIL
jgi:hypothetical protein